jgi:1-acyl-sn-glycerol-3-phosphate acyltransferase
MSYRLLWLFFRVTFRVLFRWEVYGADNVPSEGPVLLASNHISAADPPVVGTGIYRRCAFMAKEELFRFPVIGAFIRHIGAFPVRRGAGDLAALKRAIHILEQGKMLAIFPEGTRSETGELQRAEVGVGMIAYRTGAAVVPVYISGTNRVMPKAGGLRLAKVRVAYGKPLRFVYEGPPGTKPGRADYQEAADVVMREIARLRDEMEARASHRTE